MRDRLTLITTHVLLAMAVLLACTVSPQFARAVTLRQAFSVTVAPDGAYQYATYTLGNFRTANKETVTGYTITFPSDADASAATSAGAGDVVGYGADGRTVTVTLGTPIGQNTQFTIVIGNVRNPSSAGAYAITEVVFHRSGDADQVVSLGTGGGLTITPEPYLALTIAAPDPDQTVDFGSIDPGITTPVKTVTVSITSSHPYTITRQIGGEAAVLGLDVTGTAVGMKAAGTAAYEDSYTATAPWTAEGDSVYAATVTYTVVQD